MKKTIRNPAALLLAMVLVVSALTVPAFAKSDKSAKTGKGEKETSPAVCDGFAAITLDQVKEIALDDAGLDGETLKYVTCCVSWVDHAPCAYEVKFSTRAAYYHYTHYTIDLDSGAILNSSCTPHR